MANEIELGINELAPVSYSPGFIVLSYLVSLAGCATCLELLHRRTARFGLYNWATILYHGQYPQISYSSAFTAVSFFLPIVVLVIAFYFIGVSERAELWYIVFTGTLTGAAVCGMHYVGQLGIANYNCSYKPANIVGAAIIAVSASITALGVFFRMRASWTNSWWKRLISAFILAVAVSGMHWTATVGTDYRVKKVLLDSSSRLSSSQTVIVCTALVNSKNLQTFLAVITNRQHKRSAHRVRQLVLASAFFDPLGGVMVSPEGLLPTHKITNQYIDRTFADDEFSKTHPAFIWAFRASRNWATFKQLIPGMKYHLLSDAKTKRFYPGNSGAGDGGTDLDMDFESVFKELFCVAAQELADQLHQPLEKMGVLYDDVMITGTQSRRAAKHNTEDLESLYTPQMLGKGQFIFTVRHLSKEEAAHLSANGWRFAAGPQIAQNLARSMQIPPDEMLTDIENMRNYGATEKMMAPGVYLICFSLRPSVRKGFDVLVCKDAPNLLPHVALPVSSVSQWQSDILSQMNDWPLNVCLKWLKQRGDDHGDSEMRTFCQQMYKATSELADLIESPAFGTAKFSARRIMIPCRTNGSASGTGKCIAFSFRIITSLQARTTSPNLRLTPLRLFSAQQQVYPGVIDHARFQQGVLEEFGHCAAYQTAKAESTSASSVIGSSTPSGHGTRAGRRSDISKPAVSEVDDLKSNRKPAWGSIVVSNQVTVDVVERPSSYGNHSFEMQEMGLTTEARYAGPFETFVDELCAMCRETTGGGRPAY
ncbi:hypothetical protein PRK78_001082 [Emydomyces testavorans]|uniref:MHYT domain-containing protein n=1 Tax=Emydomyces testavorans TaxID=2070801 RepID=A0AAF0IIA6_9EURO|nr:hypothetical protein PRK78_001082 [Emydomyces testavorans]